MGCGEGSSRNERLKGSGVVSIKVLLLEGGLGTASHGNNATERLKRNSPNQRPNCEDGDESSYDFCTMPAIGVLVGNGTLGDLQSEDRE